MKKRKSPKQLIEAKIWQLCKEIIRKRDGKKCFICGKKIIKNSSWHTGHCFPKSNCGLYLKYDLRNLHSSCYYCNINLGGNGARFILRLEEEYGKDFVDQLRKDLNEIVPDSMTFLEEIYKEHTKMAKWSKKRLINYLKDSHV